jgi:hypothetical protein
LSSTETRYDPRVSVLKFAGLRAIQFVMVHGIVINENAPLLPGIEDEKHPRFVFVLSLFAAIGGFLFGLVLHVQRFVLMIAATTRELSAARCSCFGMTFLFLLFSRYFG